MRVNTNLCIDLKTWLNDDGLLKLNKDYTGVLTRDGEDHYVFVETVRESAGKRNPHVFVGEYITITRKDDGTYRLNFKPVKMGDGFNLDTYAIDVCNEIRDALKSLLEE